jgi:DNA ligase (NAD+)
VHKSPEACVAEGRTLRFHAFDLDEPDGAPGDVSERLRELGFEVPDVFPAATADEVRAAVEAIAERRTSYDFDIDGAVIRLAGAAPTRRPAATSAAPRGALAWKYPAEERTTILRR